jgi:hypothetical protein
MTNTLAYFIAVVIVAVKSFIEHDPGDQKPPASVIKLCSLSPMVQKDEIECFSTFLKYLQVRQDPTRVEHTGTL